MNNSYTEQYLKRFINEDWAIVVELRDGSLFVGYLVHPNQHGYYILPLDASQWTYVFHRTQIKRIINLKNGYVHPKTETSKRYKMLDLFEMSELLNKAGYEFI